MAASVFSDFMKTVLANQKNQPFSVPDGLSFVRVNRQTGVSAAEDPDGMIITEAFKPGQSPNPPIQHTTGVAQPIVGGVF